MKPKLLILELWQLGDLVMATPFLRAAVEKYDVTLVAKPFALDLQPRFWPKVRVLPFVAPWTAFAFKDKYSLWRWPWGEFVRLRRQLAEEKFEFGLSARPRDPRNHLLLKWFAVEKRFGFPHLHSEIFLTHPVARPHAEAHRYEYWLTMAKALGLELPSRARVIQTPARNMNTVLIHSGAGQAVRVWPLERYLKLAQRLRQNGRSVLVACDAAQRGWWLEAGEKNIIAPSSVRELLALIDQTGAFIGNDSGPGHLAAFCGVPTFTVFGPQLPEWWAPLHPQAEWKEGRACPYKPCWDYCRFPLPFCLWNVMEEEVWNQFHEFEKKHLSSSSASPCLESKN